MNIDDEMRCTDHRVTFMPACEKCGVSLEDVVTSLDAALDAAQDEIERLISEKEALRGQVRAVLDMHEPFGSDPGVCAGCEHYAPCPTRRAINGGGS